MNRNCAVSFYDVYRCDPQNHLDRLAGAPTLALISFVLKYYVLLVLTKLKIVNPGSRVSVRSAEAKYVSRSGCTSQAPNKSKQQAVGTTRPAASLYFALKMADGGTLAWKRQVIDQSRGPAGNYRNMKLPEQLPDNVMWQQHPETREWTLVRVDSKKQQVVQKQRYKLERCMAWNPHTGREQYSIKLQPVANAKKLTAKTLEDEEETVATATDETVNTGITGTRDYFDDDFEGEEQSQAAVEGDTPEPPILGKDYVIHTVLNSDTFSGLLLRYKIKAIELRRVNQFSGTNLSLAPSHLIIPLNETRCLQQIRLQDTESNEYKSQILSTEFPQLTTTERKAYLEMNDWDVEAALQDIRNDLQWEEDGNEEETKETMEVKIPTTTAISLDDDDGTFLTTPLLTTLKPLEVEEL
jgi:hypothetical protein